MFKNIPDVPLKTSIDVFHIRKSCRIVEKTLRYLHKHIKPGVTTKKLDFLAMEFILDSGAEPALMGYEGFPAAICTSLNSVAAHGIPLATVLEQGDILTIDITVSLDGWFGDGAWTYVVGGEPDPDKKRLITSAWQATMAGVLAVRAGGRLGDSGYYIKRTAKRFGCSILEGFGGHGIGRKMHEEPLVPHIGRKGWGMRIVPGMVFTIEPMITTGKPDAFIMEDGWSIATRDGSPCAQFEHTVAVFKDRIEILTFSEKITNKTIDQPLYF